MSHATRTRHPSALVAHGSARCTGQARLHHAARAGVCLRAAARRPWPGAARGRPGAGPRAARGQAHHAGADGQPAQRALSRRRDRGCLRRALCPRPVRGLRARFTAGLPPGSRRRRGRARDRAPWWRLGPHRIAAAGPAGRRRRPAPQSGQPCAAAPSSARQRRPAAADDRVVGHVHECRQDDLGRLPGARPGARRPACRRGQDHRHRLGQRPRPAARRGRRTGAGLHRRRPRVDRRARTGRVAAHPGRGAGRHVRAGRAGAGAGGGRRPAAA